ncbi:hypothetical protein BE17_24790 [Sorangium cellulosum]|uniref:Uncharacterized protein n=1 Tax=Sorangium cellulosum TaxID=56 RepID=A0A150SPG7_SORCE|nr:hypothetical protein BE17_24790 [Sorangium cellulosum]
MSPAPRRHRACTNFIPRGGGPAPRAEGGDRGRDASRDPRRAAAAGHDRATGGIVGAVIFDELLRRSQGEGARRSDAVA